MVKAKFLHGSQDISQCLEIRRKVFVHEMGSHQSVEPETEDKKAFHVLAELDGKPVGTLRLLFEMDGSAKLGYFAVLKEARGIGLGDMIMRMALAKIAETGCDTVLVNAIPDKCGFYRRYGFVAEDTPNYDYGQERYMMELKREDIDLVGSCKRA